jgi:hypothetical protein
MFTSQRERREDSEIVVLVDLDMQKMQVHIVWSHEAIRERLRELGTSFRDQHRAFQGVRHMSHNSQF